MRQLWVRGAGRAALVVVALTIAAPPAHAQETKVTREMIQRGQRMLAQLKKDLETYYYDSTFGGRDMEAAFRRADSAIQAAPTNNHVMAHIADYLFQLDDSHTNFYPPAHVADVDYGFSTQYVGDTLYVTRVKKGSDAEAQGLKVGDAVLAIDKIRPERHTFWMIEYLYETLSPRPGKRLVVRSLDGDQREIIAKAKITMGERTVDYTDPNTINRLIDQYSRPGPSNHIFRSLGDSVLVWRMRGFVHEDDVALETMAKRLKQHRSLILDLRGNGGGSVRTLQMLIGRFFDRDIEIGTFVTRGHDSVRVAKSLEKEPFRGLLIVLVDSHSASASEIFARTMQLQARGIVVGDRTMGAVMTSRSYGHEVGFGRRLSYGASITVMDVIMPDGGRLEKIGVIPDHLVLPTGADLAAGRDPQMAKALELVGVTVTPEQAARFGRGPAPR